MIFLWRGCVIFLTTVNTDTAVTTVLLLLLFLFFYFLSTFGKSNLTTDVVFSGQRFVILVMFLFYKKQVVLAGTAFRGQEY